MALIILLSGLLVLSVFKARNTEFMASSPNQSTNRSFQASRPTLSNVYDPDDPEILKQQQSAAEADAAVGFNYTSLYQERPKGARLHRNKSKQGDPFSADVAFNSWWNTTGYNLRWNPVPTFS